MTLKGRLKTLEHQAAALDAAREAALDAAGDRMVRGDARDADVALWARHYDRNAADILATVETVRRWSDEELLAYLREGNR
jgi:hypothetical protein